MSILIICEKPSHANEYKNILSDGDRIHLCTSINSYKFKYPVNLRFSDLPFCEEVLNYTHFNPSVNESFVNKFYTTYFDTKGSSTCPILLDFYNSKFKDKTEIADISKSNLHRLIASYDEIVFACDPDHTGIRGFDFLFEKYYGIENFSLFCKENNIKATVLDTLKAVSHTNIENEFNNRSDFFSNSLISNLRLYYMKKDFFEYNYNVNSLMLFNKAYLLSCSEKSRHESFVITKNIIQTLFLLQSKQSDFQGMKLHNIISLMSHNHIGSPASRHSLCDILFKLGLIHSEGSYGNLTLSNLAKSFLSKLHRKVNDPHLIQRLSGDLENSEFSLDLFRDKYSKYLNTVFSKQNRFLNKIQ